MRDVSLRVHASIADVPREEWDALRDDASTPFESWTFLEALEHSGCVAPETGWTPHHLALRRDGRLVAAAPAYVKRDSAGDFSRDWGFARFAAERGLRYYPKLVLCVPFTPVTGRRVLVARGEDRAARVTALARAARGLAAEEGLGAVQVLYALADEAAELGAAGLTPRRILQFHWRNAGYRAPEDWLARLRSKRRNQARREMAAPARLGIAIRTVRGAEIRAEHRAWAGEVHRLYRATTDKHLWGRPHLNRGFFERVFARMPEHVEVVEARRAGRLVAGAFNVSGARRLYGRYWGCHEEHPFLHFNVCLYHSIRDCILRGLEVFEGGAGGEHKLWRDFEPVLTHSAMALGDARLDRTVRAYLAAETRVREGELAAWREHNGR